MQQFCEKKTTQTAFVAKMIRNLPARADRRHFFDSFQGIGGSSQKRTTALAATLAGSKGDTVGIMIRKLGKTRGGGVAIKVRERAEELQGPGSRNDFPSHVENLLLPSALGPRSSALQSKRPAIAGLLLCIGWDGRDRTYNLRSQSPSLCQLSYIPSWEGRGKTGPRAEYFPRQSRAPPLCFLAAVSLHAADQGE